eukprot:3703491-Prymnesium_polylepis.1
MGQTAMASFKFEMEDVTLAEVEREWEDSSQPSESQRPNPSIVVTALGKTSIGHSMKATPRLNVVLPKKKGLGGAPVATAKASPKLAFNR